MSFQDYVDIGLAVLTFASLVLHKLHSTKAAAIAADLDAVKALVPKASP